MSLMRRLSMIFKSKAARALDAAEDPRETLDYSYERTVEMLQKMRRAVTDVATSRKRLEIQGQQLEATATKLEGQARRALEQDREDLAREALSRREAVATQLEDIHRQHQQLQNQESKLVASARRLESKVAAFRTRKETIKATYSAAEAETKVNEAVSGISEEMGDVGLAMQRAEDKVMQMQARSQALDELMASGAIEDVAHGGDDIERQLGSGGNDTQVELELARLKNELVAPEERSELESSKEGERG
ncbi:MAG: PspA/IM30 family protein [Actinomycetota bacterium]|nr:PspA/IM30 family protein [Actinomycetota bacterium]